MLDKIFTLYYSNKLVLEMLHNAKIGFLAVNFFGPLVISLVLYTYLPLPYLLLWFSLHIFLLFLRLNISYKLINSLENHNHISRTYFCLYILVISLSALLLGLSGWMGIIYQIPEINMFIIGIVIIALTAGSIATLGTVFIVFVGFMFFSMIPFILALLYHGDLIFNIFASILFIFLVIHLISGYKLYLMYKHTTELEQKYKTIYHKSSLGIAIIKNYDIIECNETLLQMFNYQGSMKDFLYFNIYKNVPSNKITNKAYIKKILTQLKKVPSQDVTFEWEHIKENGETFWVEISLTQMKLNNEYVIQGTWKDISDRKKISDELKFLNTSLELKIKNAIARSRQRDKQFIKKESKQKEYLNIVIESSNHAIIAIDKNKTILTYNQKAEEIFGFTQKEMLGSNNLLHIIPLKYKNLYTLASTSYFNTEKSNEIISKTLELEGLRKDGKVIPIRISFGSSKNKKLVIANIYDLSQEKIQENILQQQSKLAQMGEMISMIAHQWRQPLSAISSTAGGINLKANLNKLDNSSAIKLSSEILEYSKHLSTTIDDFREFFKANKKKENTTYTQLIKSVLGIMESSIHNQDIKLIQSLQCNEYFSTYANELKQVILNLIKNAEDILLEKNIKNPYIKIATYKVENYFILEVSDNAGGIPLDIINKIFDPYFSTKMKKDGTGLGLYMSKTIIEEHCNGKLTASNNVEGAVFKISLQ